MKLLGNSEANLAWHPVLVALDHPALTLPSRLGRLGRVENRLQLAKAEPAELRVIAIKNSGVDKTEADVLDGVVLDEIPVAITAEEMRVDGLLEVPA